jgi:hypothetical protein
MPVRVPERLIIIDYQHGLDFEQVPAKASVEPDLADFTGAFQPERGWSRHGSLRVEAVPVSLRGRYDAIGFQDLPKARLAQAESA